MPKTVIPRENWMAFFDEFNRENRGKIVKIEITDDEDYRVDYAESLPLQDVQISSKDHDNTSVQVSAGISSSFTHIIDQADTIILVENEEEYPRVLQIRSALGRSAIIRFHPVGINDSVR